MATVAVAEFLHDKPIELHDEVVITNKYEMIMIDGKASDVCFSACLFSNDHLNQKCFHK